MKNRATITLPNALRAQAEAVKGRQSMNSFIQDALRLLITVRTAQANLPRLPPIKGDP